MMDVLRAAQTLQLPDWWIAAGFLRSKVWDFLHGFSERTPLGDVDLIYFDPADVEKSAEITLQDQLHETLPHVPWSVKNEARMHTVNGLLPYDGTVDAISKFPETATAVGVTLTSDGNLHFAAPWGIADLLNLIVRPTPMFAGQDYGLAHTYADRVKSKEWTRKWPKVRIISEGVTS